MLLWPPRSKITSQLIDVTRAGGDLGTQVRRRIMLGEQLPGHVGIVGGGELSPVNDPDGRLGAHHTDLSLRPGEHVVGAEVLRVHRDERPAESLAEDHRDPRHGRLCERVHEGRAEADHALATPAGCRHEPGRVDEHRASGCRTGRTWWTNRAPFSEPAVEHAAEVARLVGDHADVRCLDPRKSGHEVARPTGRDLEQLAAVDDRADHVAQS